MTPTRADHCVVACADAFRGDGEILASAFGVVPSIAVRLARATFEPDLLLSDGEAMLMANRDDAVVEGWLPFRDVFGVVASGRRHVVMMPGQVDRLGNMNISCVGDWGRPRVQLIGARGAPGNTVNHATTYWVPAHSPRVFVQDVDFISGIGSTRGARDLRYVVTNLCVFDFGGGGGVLRLRSVHPGVRVEDVLEATGFEPEVPDLVPQTRTPTDEELAIVAALDPSGDREAEIAS